MAKKLTRSTKNKIIGGVCAGIADYFDIDPTIVRVVYLLLSLCSACFPGLIVYIIMLLIVPQDNKYIEQ